MVLASPHIFCFLVSGQPYRLELQPDRREKTIEWSELLVTISSILTHSVFVGNSQMQRGIPCLKVNLQELTPSSRHTTVFSILILTFWSGGSVG